MTTDSRSAREHELLLLITPWAITRRSSEGISHHPLKQVPFHKYEKGIEELREQLTECPDPQDESPLCCFASPYYSFVPEDLYDEADQERMLELAFSESFPKEGVRTERAQVANARVVHWFPEALQKLLTERFPGYIPQHFTIPAIETLLALHTRSGKATGLAHIREREVDVGFAADHGLRIFNSFSYANAEELVYFILHTWRSCGAGEALEEFHVSGTVEQGMEKGLLERYVEAPIYHEDGKGSWSSFLLEDLREFEDHRRKA